MSHNNFWVVNISLVGDINHIFYLRFITFKVANAGSWSQTQSCMGPVGSGVVMESHRRSTSSQGERRCVI